MAIRKFTRVVLALAAAVIAVLATPAQLPVSLPGTVTL